MELLPARNLTHSHSRMPSKYNPKAEQTVFEIIPKSFQCPQKRAWILNCTWVLGGAISSVRWSTRHSFSGNSVTAPGRKITLRIGMGRDAPELSQWPTIRSHVSAHDGHIPLKSVTIKCHKSASQHSPPKQKLVMLTGEWLYGVHYSSTSLKGNRTF